MVKYIDALLMVVIDFYSIFYKLNKKLNSKAHMLSKDKHQLGISLVKSKELLNTFAHRLANL